MYTEAFDAWLSLFNKDVVDTWIVERKELRNIAMLLCVLDLEFKRIQKVMSGKFDMWEKKLNSIEDFKGNTQDNQISPQSKKSILQVQKENKKPEDYNSLPGIIPLHNSNNPNQALLSADAFPKSSSSESGTEFKHSINDSPKGEKNSTSESSMSPKLNKFRKFFRPKQPRDITNSLSLLDVTNTPKITPKVIIADSFTSTPDKTCNESKDLIETTIIDVTPEPPHKIKKIKHNKVRNLFNQRKNLKAQKSKRASSNSTLTQMFSNVIASTKNEESIKKDDDIDFTYCPNIDTESIDKFSEQKQGSNLNNPSKNDDDDTDFTYCPLDINFMSLKKNNNKQFVKSVTKSCLSKFQDEGNLNCNISIRDTLKEQTLKTSRKSEIPFKFKMKPVRGKERLKLEGWDCEECRKFYEGIGENYAEAKNFMNICSRHRNKFKPDDFTIPGFWDLKFTPTQDTEENESTIFNF